MSRARLLHSNLRELSDYVREVAPPAERERIRKHLEGGCPACSGDERFMRQILAFAGREARVDIPEAEVLHVKQLAALQQPRRVYVGVRRAATLLFDSFRQPFAVGVRNASHAARHSLYCGSGYCIDFQQNAAAGGRAVRLIGQVTLSAGTRREVPDATVLLKAGREILARATTNEFGEFAMEYAPRPNFRLVLHLAGTNGARTRRAIEGNR